VFACAAGEPIAVTALGETLALQPGEATFVQQGE
jgi:hypothetical protein